MTEAAQRVGVTRSGKAIQVPIFDDEQQQTLPVACAVYTAADHFDAHAVFEYLISRELSRRPRDTTSVLAMYERMSGSHSSKLDENWHQVERLALGLATIFNVLEHGKGLADRIFKN